VAEKRVDGGYREVEGQLEAPRHLARTVHDLYFEPKYEEFKTRTIWSLSNAFTSAFKKLDPVPQFKGYGQAGRVSGSPVLTIVLAGAGHGSPPLPIKCCRLWPDVISATPSHEPDRGELEQFNVLA
jgi:hypothetical protein